MAKASSTTYPRISANKLMQVPIEEMESVLGGYFILVFEDGELLTSVRPTIYSAYGWEILKHFPKIKLSKRHHLTHYFPIDPSLTSQAKLVNGGAQTKILAEIVNDWFEAYPDYQDDDKILLMKHFFHAVNRLYNELQLKAEAYVGSISVTALVDLINHPKLRACRDGVKITQASVVDIQRNMINILKNDPELADNQIIRFLRAGLTKESQLVQCIGPWGFPRDIDEYVFPYAIERGYGEGIRSFRDSMMESRTASRALHLAGPALQNTEYFSRRATITGMQVERLHRGDCGSQNYHMWTVQNQKDLEGHEGVWYWDKEANCLKDVRRSDSNLIGRTLKIRTIEGCIHPDPNGICETCYGKLARNVFKRTNIGSQSTTTTTSNNSQKLLSNKHEVKTAVVDSIVLDEVKAQFFTVIGGDGYGLRPDRLGEGKINRLIIPKAVMVNITDALEDNGLKNISPSRVTKISGIKYVCERLDSKGSKTSDDVSIPMDMSFQHRYAYMTRDLLQYIKDKGWNFDRSGNYIIDLSEWDTSKVLMMIPKQVLSTMNFSKDLENMLEGSVKEREERSMDTVASFIDGFYDLATKKLDVSWSALQTMAYAATVVDNTNYDASLPKPWTKGAPGIKNDTMFQRSISVSMAFQAHKNFLTDPDNFLHTNRPDHVLDWMFLPQEVSKYRQY